MLKLVSVNVERSKHLERVVPFLERERPEVLCLQEVSERDISRFEDIIGPCLAFAPITLFQSDASETPFLIGNAIFTSQELVAVEAHYYRGSDASARAEPAKKTMQDINLIRADIRRGRETFRIMTTHFTWTPDGQSSEQQRIDVRALVNYLGTSGEFVLCGDFNAPRGGEIFAAIAAKYKDNVPPEYEGSIDVKLHRSGHLVSEEMDKKMVDGLFTSPGYEASHVRLQDSVSDHKAIVAHITRV